jgi:hypothetical protein
MPSWMRTRGVSSCVHLLFGRGHFAVGHPHAIRILGRAWAGVIWRMWHDHTPYNPALHGGLQRLITQNG